MKANFKQIKVEVMFDEYKELDIAKSLGNYIHQNTTDIGLDDTARAIYHSEGEVEISNEHAAMILTIVQGKDSPYLAATKRAIINELTEK